MNVFFRELKAYQKSTFIWIASLCTLVVVFLLMFPAFTKDVEATRAIMANLPLAVRNALDISLQNFFTVYGFFAYLLTFASLAGAVQAMNIGVGIISKEDSGKTVDFLLTKPISRIKVVTNKILAAVFILLLTNLIFILVALSTAAMVSVSSFDAGLLLLIALTLLFVQLFFLAFGILLSVLIPKIKSTISVSLPVVFGFFVIGMLGAVIGNDNVRYICPFKFYDSNYIIDHSAYDIKFLIIEAVFILLAITASYVIYLRKDIRAVS